MCLHANEYPGYVLCNKQNILVSETCISPFTGFEKPGYAGSRYMAVYDDQHAEIKGKCDCCNADHAYRSQQSDAAESSKPNCAQFSTVGVTQSVQK